MTILSPMGSDRNFFPGVVMCMEVFNKSLQSMLQFQTVDTDSVLYDCNLPSDVVLMKDVCSESSRI